MAEFIFQSAHRTCRTDIGFPLPCQHLCTRNTTETAREAADTRDAPESFIGRTEPPLRERVPFVHALDGGVGILSNSNVAERAHTKSRQIVYAVPLGKQNLRLLRRTHTPEGVDKLVNDGNPKRCGCVLFRLFFPLYKLGSMG